MNCDMARQMLVFARPGISELDAADIASLEQHLADCAECMACNRAERAWDDRMSLVMRSVVAPSDVQNQLMGRLNRERWLNRGRWGVMLAAACGVGAGIWQLVPSPR